MELRFCSKESIVAIEMPIEKAQKLYDFLGTVSIYNYEYEYPVEEIRKTVDDLLDVMSVLPSKPKFSVGDFVVKDGAYGKVVCYMGISEGEHRYTIKTSPVSFLATVRESSLIPA